MEKFQSTKNLLVSQKRHYVLLGIFVFLVVLFLYLSVWYDDSLKRIKERGTIVMLTWNDPHSYYLYRNEKMGFEYDLAKDFADFVGVNLEVKLAREWNDLIPWLLEGKGDFIAAGMTGTPKRKRVIDFSNSYMTVQQQVVVRRKNRGLKKPEDLVGKTVVVRKGTSYKERLERIRDTIGDFSIETNNKPTAELIEMLSRGIIDITVADSHIAMLNRRYYPNIKFACALGKPEYLGWGIKEGQRSLRRKINAFFDLIKGNGEYERLYEKYYGYVDLFDYVDLKRFERTIRSKLPKYESIIKTEAKRYGFDWRLIAAIIYQESHFNPHACSWTGVRGLMQLTQATAREVGITDRLDPIESIRGGTKYLKKLYDSFSDIIDKHDRMLIALAAYNVGKRHVLDAQQIALEKGLRPDRWNSLKKTLPLLREKKYYKKAKAGYCRGSEPVRYVQYITIYYDKLRQKEIKFEFVQRKSTRLFT